MSKVPVSIELMQYPKISGSTTNVPSTTVQPIIQPQVTQPIIQPQVTQGPLVSSESLATIAKASPVVASADVAKEAVKNPKTIVIVIVGILIALLIIVGVVYFIAEKFFGGISGLFNTSSGFFNNISGSISH